MDKREIKGMMPLTDEQVENLAGGYILDQGEDAGLYRYMKHFTSHKNRSSTRFCSLSRRAHSHARRQEAIWIIRKDIRAAFPLLLAIAHSGIRV